MRASSGDERRSRSVRPNAGPPGSERHIIAPSLSCIRTAAGYRPTVRCGRHHHAHQPAMAPHRRISRADSQQLPTTQRYYPHGTTLCRLGDDGSHGSYNRQAIASREARVATGLRAVQRAYRKATEREAAAGHSTSPRYSAPLTTSPTGSISGRALQLSRVHPEPH